MHLTMPRSPEMCMVVSYIRMTASLYGQLWWLGYTKLTVVATPWERSCGTGLTTTEVCEEDLSGRQEREHFLKGVLQ